MTTTHTLLPNGTPPGSGDFTVTGVALIHVQGDEMRRFIAAIDSRRLSQH